VLDPATNHVVDDVDFAWIMAQRWEHLLLCSWRYPVEHIAALVPAGLRPDIHDGDAWVSAVALHVAHVHLRDVPTVDLGTFAELTVRTYVRATDDADDRGVWCFSVDVASDVLAWIARHVLHSPSHHSKTALRGDGPYAFSCTRDGDARFDATFKPAGAMPREHSALARFLTDRHRVYVTTHDGHLRRRTVRGPKWELMTADGTVFDASVLTAAGLDAPDGEPNLLYSSGVEARLGRVVGA